MGKAIDFSKIIGKKYGRLTILERAENKYGRSAVLCRCDCGKEKIICWNDIVQGKSTSCGRCKSNIANDDKLISIGDRFGKWVIIDYAEKRQHKSGSSEKQWLCRCECGTEKNVLQKSLLNGESKSCGRCKNNLVGQVFGRLSVVEKACTKYGKQYWRCKCLCGGETIACTSSLRRGQVRSCGCLHNELLSEMMTTHGGAKEQKDRLYKVWLNMKTRCYNKNRNSYHNYGGRGIAVCDEWKEDYGAFRDWALANGYDENAKRGQCTLDRINVNGNYCPENCRWITQKEQGSNIRKNIILTYYGVAHTLPEWADILKIPYSVLQPRIKRGWTVEEAFETPVRSSKHGTYTPAYTQFLQSIGLNPENN